MASSKPLPIACTLGPQDYEERISWIRTLTLQALREHRREGLVLRLAFAPDAVGRVRAMVERERACCAFLTFELHERPDAVHLKITAPEAARGLVDLLFRQFLPENASQGCVCS
jgi:hypothetical protein